MNIKVIDITVLTNLCITRSRGKEAATKLSRLLNNNHIEIDLSKAELVSLSFLDELVCSYRDAVDKGIITFITSDKNTETKLSRISTVRSISIHCRGIENSIYFTVPIEKYLMPDPVFSNSKD